MLVVGGIGCHIQSTVDSLRNGLNLCSKLLFNLVQVEPIFVCDQINGQTKMAESPRATNAVQVSLAVLREIKVDHHIDSLDIDTTGKEVRTDQVAADAATEIMKYAIAMRLEHFGV